MKIILLKNKKIKKKDLNFLPMYLLNEFDFTETMFYPHHFLISTVQIVSFLEPP